MSSTRHERSISSSNGTLSPTGTLSGSGYQHQQPAQLHQAQQQHQQRRGSTSDILLAPALLTSLDAHSSPDQRQQEPEHTDAAVLAIAIANGSDVFAGAQDGSVHVWTLDTLSRRGTLVGHTGAVLALEVIPENDWLASSSSDGTIRIWDIETLLPIYLVHSPTDNTGDIFSLAWLPDSDLARPSRSASVRSTASSFLAKGDEPKTEMAAARAPGREEARAGKQKRERVSGTLFAGCQDASVQWIQLPPPSHLSRAATTDSSVAHADDPSQEAFHDTHTTSQVSLATPPPTIVRPSNIFFDRAPPKRNASGSSLASLPANATAASGAATPLRVAHGASDQVPSESGTTSEANAATASVWELQVDAHDSVPWAHSGYIYAMVRARRGGEELLVTGSGDQHIKLWRITGGKDEGIGVAVTLLATLGEQKDFAVLSLAVGENLALFAGYQGGFVKVWDIETLTCVKMLRPHHDDILSLTVIADELYSADARGSVQRWDRSFHLVSSWDAHDDMALSLASDQREEGICVLLSGGNDGLLRIWDPPQMMTRSLMNPRRTFGFQGELFHALSRFVAYRTIADDEHREECRQGAIYLKQLLADMGASTSLLAGASGRNALVLGVFQANSTRAAAQQPRPKRVLFYGHYDVVGAAGKWRHDPFVMTGENGYIYGRGVSDNKGPTLAVAAAASELWRAQKLDVDVVMLIEGEEEAGSAGFMDAIRHNRGLIGDIDCILVSNSYWLGESIPSITFGLRGVIHANVEIRSGQPALHSGMQGGVVDEPLLDLVKLLASLKREDGSVAIPHFTDDVPPVTDDENELYDIILKRCPGPLSEKLVKHSNIDNPRQSLIAKWRLPALSIHTIQAPGLAEKTLIPSKAAASISIRVVPNQSIEFIANHLQDFLHANFARSKSTNSLSIEIEHVADWWLGNLKSPYFLALAKSIEEEWDIEPMLIREGGSIPSIPFLEREFCASAVHFPMGTSSDSAHLPNERIRILNLEHGRSIVRKWLCSIA